MAVVVLDVLFDRLDERRDVREAPSAYPVGGDLPEPALDEVQPG